MRFKKKCDKIGQNVRIQGKVIFSGQGKLNCGDNLLIRTAKFNPVRIHIDKSSNLTLGKQVFLNLGVHLSCSKEIIIGNHVDFGEDCLIIDNDFSTPANLGSLCVPPPPGIIPSFTSGSPNIVEVNATL